VAVAYEDTTEPAEQVSVFTGPGSAKVSWTSGFVFGMQDEEAQGAYPLPIFDDCGDAYEGRDEGPRDEVCVLPSLR